MAATLEGPVGHISYHLEAVRRTLAHLIASLPPARARAICGPLASTIFQLEDCVRGMTETVGFITARTKLDARFGPNVEAIAYRSAFHAISELLISGPCSHGDQIDEQSVRASSKSRRIGVIAFDESLRYTAWDAGMTSITGLTKEQVLGKDMAFVEAGHEERWRRVLAGEAISVVRAKYVNAVVDVTYAPLLSSDGRIVGGVAVVHEVVQGEV